MGSLPFSKLRQNHSIFRTIQFSLPTAQHLHCTLCSTHFTSECLNELSRACASYVYAITCSKRCARRNLDDVNVMHKIKIVCECMEHNLCYTCIASKLALYHLLHWQTRYIIRDRGSDLYVGIDMVKNYCLYKWYGRCSAKKGQKLSQITPN